LLDNLEIGGTVRFLGLRFGCFYFKSHHAQMYGSVGVGWVVFEVAVHDFLHEQIPFFNGQPFGVGQPRGSYPAS